MKRWDMLALAYQNVGLYRARAFLCCLSIAIGIFAVVVISMISDLALSVVNTQLEDMGIRGLSVYQSYETAMSLSPDHATLLEKNLSFVDSAMPVITEFGSFRSQRDSDSAVFWGVDFDFEKTFDVKLLHGRLHGKQDISFQTKTAVVDETLAMQLYHRSNIVGKTLSIFVGGIEERVEIVGVIKTQKAGFETMLGGKMPSFVYIPYTLLADLRGSDSLNQIAIKCVAGQDLDEARIQIASFLNRQSTLRDSISVENLDQYTKATQNIALLIGSVLVLIAAISLFVASIGVCSTMYGSVSERRSEIGIYMALGAKKSDILGIFISEAVILCCIGCFFGVSLGSLVFLAVVSTFGLAIGLNPLFIGGAVVVSVACGLLSGVFPAKKAAALYPMEALRDA